MTDNLEMNLGAENSAPENKTKKKTLNQKHKNYIFVILCLLYPMGLWAFFFFTTNIKSFILAFQKIDFHGNVSFNGFNNFKLFFDTIFKDSDYLGIAFVNSFKNFFIPLSICLPLYLIFSYYIFKKARGSKIVQSISMIPRLIPGMVMSLVFKLFVEESLPNMLDSLLGVKNFPNLFAEGKYVYGTSLFYTIWLSFSTSLIVYPNAMNSIQQEIFESGEIDGIDNFFSEMWYIILPLIYPTISTFLITNVAGFLMDGGALVTFWLYYAPREAYNVGYYYYIQTFQAANEMGYPMLSAGGMIMTLIMAPITLLVKWALEKFGPSVE